MLFDERELNIFDNNEARTYFKEILQSYYGQNYRATIVLLYSFVIYDLFIKLQNMANEGEHKAKTKVDEINGMIADDEKYSKVENEIIEFYKENCSVYFNRFIEDIEYLKKCRNKCAHLKVNDNSLYVPSDYQVRMLICSMYDNILSVKAPFIGDLFYIAKVDVEYYSTAIEAIVRAALDEAIIQDIKNKYLKRMTYDSIKKSYKTFVKLLFVSSDEDCINYTYGLYAFTYALTDYIVKSGYIQIFDEPDIQGMFGKIDCATFDNNEERRNAMMSIMIHFPIIMDFIRVNCDNVFDYISKGALSSPRGIELYRVFYPRAEKTVFTFFCESEKLKQANYTETLYKALKESEDFDINEFMRQMVMAIPRFSSFSEADSFMTSFLLHLEEMSVEGIQGVMTIYKRNSQCTNRNRHSSDIVEVNKHLETRCSKETN